MKNGDVLKGMIMTAEIQWQAPYAMLKVKRDHIKAIRLKREGQKAGILELVAGDKISGRLANKSIDIRLSYGQTIKVETAHIKTINLQTIQ